MSQHLQQRHQTRLPHPSRRPLHPRSRRSLLWYLLIPLLYLLTNPNPLCQI